MIFLTCLIFVKGVTSLLKCDVTGWRGYARVNPRKRRCGNEKTVGRASVGHIYATCNSFSVVAPIVYSNFIKFSYTYMAQIWRTQLSSFCQDADQFHILAFNAILFCHSSLF